MSTMNKSKADPTRRNKIIVVSLLVILCIAAAVVVPVVLVAFRALDNHNDSSSSSSSSSTGTGGSSAVGNQTNTVDSTDAPSTSFPTESPTAAPTSTPSAAPTTSASPSANPTQAPTEFLMEPNPVPLDPPPGYFNYNVDDQEYGPNVWSRVDTNNHPIREFGPNGFGAWDNSLQVDPTENRCTHNEGTRQSPKDLVQEDGIIIPGDGNDGKCDATHEIRTRCGSFNLGSDMYQKNILPHKLSLVMNRRACLDTDRQECREGRPPIADYPKYSSTGSDFSDLLYFDVKVPGEHTIAGETFDAEIQMLHAHLTNRKLSSIGIPIRATVDGHNDEFQDILDQFHTTHYLDAQACLKQRRHLLLRHDDKEVDMTKFYENLMEQAVRGGFYNEHSAQMTDPDFRRKLQQIPSSYKFNPYSEQFMVDLFFFRYPGSMTEPPCMIVTWWVMDKPMIISLEQLRQIKFLLFTHVDGNCTKTSVHNAQQSVARPIQPLGEPELAWIQHCETGSFEPDIIQQGEPGRRCFA